MHSDTVDDQYRSQTYRCVPLTYLFCFRFEASYEQDTDVSIQEHIDLLSSEVDSVLKNQEETLKAVRQIMATKQKMLIVEVPRGRKRIYVPVEVPIRHTDTT